MTFRQVNSSKKQFCSGFFGIFTNYTAVACVNIYNTTRRLPEFVSYRTAPCISVWLAGKDFPFIIVNELAGVRANCGRPLGAKFTSVRVNRACPLGAKFTSVRANCACPLGAKFTSGNVNCARPLVAALTSARRRGSRTLRDCLSAYPLSSAPVCKEASRTS